MLKLSIAIITMNRAEQLREAIMSCFDCILPDNTEFVIVDNASTDNTEKVVKDLFVENKYMLKYKKSDINLGVGRGRNLAYQSCNGDIIYALDDDAVIDTKKNPDFFERVLAVFEECPRVVAISTQIYDEAWKGNRLEITGKEVFPGVFRSRMFYGGSHFLRHSFYQIPPYLANHYGYEELPPSLCAYDNGFEVVTIPDIRVIHKPKVDKWSREAILSQEFRFKDCYIPFLVKKAMYPSIFYPLVVFAYKRRIKKHVYQMNIISSLKPAVTEELSNCLKDFGKVKVLSVVKLFLQFGVAIF